MEIKISKVRRALSQEWDEAWQNCDYATYFHSREWAEIWNVYSRGNLRPEPRSVLFSDGKTALIPLSCKLDECQGARKVYVSSPEGTFGGYISIDDLGVEHTKLLVDYMLRQCGNLEWRVNPYDKNIFETGIKKDPERETYMLHLSIGMESIFKRFSSANVRAIKKAGKDGIAVRSAAEFYDWEEYYRLYEDSLSRWGEKTKSRYGWELFKEMHDRHSARIRLWVSLYKDKIVAGALCFYAKKHVVYWHGAALKDYFLHRPVNLLLYEVIKDAHQNGYTWFDFNPSRGLEGVIAFKKGFGTETLNCPVIRVKTRETVLNRAAGFLRRRGISK